MRKNGLMQICRKNLTRVILLSMSTRGSIPGEMWGEMSWVCWGIGEVMDELKVL